jgi:hypothetical protein
MSIRAENVEVGIRKAASAYLGAQATDEKLDAAVAWANQQFAIELALSGDSVEACNTVFADLQKMIEGSPSSSSGPVESPKSTAVASPASVSPETKTATRKRPGR